MTRNSSLDSVFQERKSLETQLKNIQQKIDGDLDNYVLKLLKIMQCTSDSSPRFENVYKGIVDFFDDRYTESDVRGAILRLNMYVAQRQDFRLILKIPEEISYSLIS